MSTSIEGYHALIQWRNGEHEDSYLTADERQELIGHECIDSAVYTPLVPCAQGAVAWLVEHVSPGPFVTPDEHIALAYVEQGATVWGLGRMQ